MAEVDIDIIGRDEATNVIGDVTGALGGLGIGGMALAGALGGILKDAFDATTQAVGDFLGAALETEQQQAGLAALIKSTGGAAGLTQEAVNALAMQFRDLAGGSDEAIVSIQEIGIRSGAITSEQMPGFIQSVLDLGTVMGSTTSAATLLARAQEDPMAALGKLQRAGVVFTEELKEQIKTMAASGDTAGATALLMDRVAEATGGSAAAQADTLAGRWEILQNHLEDAGKGILLELLPPLEALFDEYIAPAIPLIENFAAVIGDGVGYLASFADGTRSISGALEEWGGPIEFLAQAFGLDMPAALQSFDTSIGDIIRNIVDNWPQIQLTMQEVWGNVQLAIEAVVGVWNNVLWPALVAVWSWIQTELVPLFVNIAEAVIPVLQERIAILSGFWTNTLLPAIQALVVWAKAELLPMLSTLWTWFAANLPGAIATLMDWQNKLLAIYLDFLGWYWANLGPLLANLWDWLKVAIPAAIATLSDFWTNTLLPAITAVWSWVTTSLLPTLSTLWTWLKETLTAALQTLADFWSETLLPAITAVWEWMKDPLFPFLESLADLADAVLGLAVKNLAGYWKDTLQPALEGVWKYMNENVFPLLKDVQTFLADTFAPIFTTVGDAINSFVGGALAWLQSVIASISQGITDLTSYINGLIALINGIPTIPGAPQMSFAGGGGGGGGGSTVNNSSQVSVYVSSPEPGSADSLFTQASILAGAF